MDILIRRIKEEDIEIVVDIKIDGWRTAYKGIIEDNFLKNMKKQEEIEKCKKNYSTIGFIVAEVDKKVVGFCRYKDMENKTNEDNDIDCEIKALYVKSEHKRNGIGRKLLKYAVNEFIKKGNRKMVIWCLKDNYSSRAFYEKMGGKIYKYKKEMFGEKEYELISYVYDLNNMKENIKN